MSNDHVATTIASYNAFAVVETKKNVNYAPAKERDVFLSKLTKQATILDAGCGPGRDSEYFCSKGHEVTGIDLASSLIAIAKQRAPNATFTSMDLRNITFPDKSFDGIWACASLLHLERTEAPAVLAAFYRILKPGGILFLLVKEGVGKKLVRSGMAGNKRRFFTFFQLREVRSLVTETGLFVEDIYTWNQKDRWPERSSKIWISCFARKK
jgi:ubiquinone/menaquinone biosynthesis C-methylase UbiE